MRRRVVYDSYEPMYAVENLPWLASTALYRATCPGLLISCRPLLSAPNDSSLHCLYVHDFFLRLFHELCVRSSIMTCEKSRTRELFALFRFGNNTLLPAATTTSSHIFARRCLIIYTCNCSLTKTCQIVTSSAYSFCRSNDNGSSRAPLRLTAN